MATYRTSGAGGTAVDNTPATATVVPVAGDLLVVAVVETGTGPFGSGAPGLSDDNADQGVGTQWISIGSTTFNGGAGYIQFWVRGFLMRNTTSTIITYLTTGSPTTAVHIAWVALSGMGAAGIAAIRQSVFASGAAGAAAATFAAAPLTANPLLIALGDLTNPPGLTAPASFTNRQNVGNAQPEGLIVATVNSGVTAATITEGSNPATAWGIALVEFDSSASGIVYQDKSSLFGNASAGTVSGPYARGNSPFPRVSRRSSVNRYPAVHNSAITVPVLMRGIGSDLGIAGLTLVVKLRKIGNAYATITPTSVTDRGGGMYDVVVAAGDTAIAGLTPMRITAASVANIEDTIPNDDIVLDIQAAPAGAADLTSSLANEATIIANQALILAAASNIAVTGAALNAPATSRTLTTGTETLTYASTVEADGAYHEIASVAGALDFYYIFDLTATIGAVGVGCQWRGYVAGLVNTIKVYAWNFNSSGWEQIGTIVGIAGAVTMTEEWELTSGHTGTAFGSTIARIRFAATGLTAASVKTDRILLGFAAVPPTVAAIQSGLATATALAADTTTITDAIAAVALDVDDIDTRTPAALSADGYMKSDVQTWLEDAPLALDDQLVQVAVAAGGGGLPTQSGAVVKQSTPTIVGIVIADSQDPSVGYDDANQNAYAFAMANIFDGGGGLQYAVSITPSSDANDIQFAFVSGEISELDVSVDGSVVTVEFVHGVTTFGEAIAAIMANPDVIEDLCTFPHADVADATLMNGASSWTINLEGGNTGSDYELWLRKQNGETYYVGPSLPHIATRIEVSEMLLVKSYVLWGPPPAGSFLLMVNADHIDELGEAEVVIPAFGPGDPAQSRLAIKTFQVVEELTALDIVEAMNDDVHDDTGEVPATFRGLKIRIDSNIRGAVPNDMNASGELNFMKGDGTTPAITIVQDVDAGTRETGDIAGSEED